VTMPLRLYWALANIVGKPAHESFLWLRRNGAMSGGVVQQPQGQPANGYRAEPSLGDVNNVFIYGASPAPVRVLGRQDVLAYLQTKSSSPNVLVCCKPSASRPKNVHCRGVVCGPLISLTT